MLNEIQHIGATDDYIKERKLALNTKIVCTFTKQLIIELCLSDDKIISISIKIIISISIIIIIIFKIFSPNKLTSCHACIKLKPQAKEWKRMVNLCICGAP